VKLEKMKVKMKMKLKRGQNKKRQYGTETSGMAEKTVAAGWLRDTTYA